MRLSPPQSAAATLLIGVALASGFFWGAAAAPLPPARIVFLDVGQGESAYVESPRGNKILIDAGRADAMSNTGRSVVIPFLRSQGVNRLDALVVTHWDADHAGGTSAVLRGVGAQVMFVPERASEVALPDAVESDALAAAHQARTKVVRLVRGHRLTSSDGLVMDVLNPPRAIEPTLATDNNRSLVLSLRYGQARFLFSGDAEAEAEASMLAAGLDVRADVLKVGHHGSRSGTGELFLHAVAPQAAVVSAGKRNAFGHPHPLVLERIAARSVRLFRTDEMGAITAATDGHRIHITTHLR